MFSSWPDSALVAGVKIGSIRGDDQQAAVAQVVDVAHLAPPLGQTGQCRFEQRHRGPLRAGISAYFPASATVNQSQETDKADARLASRRPGRYNHRSDAEA